MKVTVFQVKFVKTQFLSFLGPERIEKGTYNRQSQVASVTK